MKSAIKFNRIHVLNWLERERVLPKPTLVVECQHEQSAYWLHEHGYSLSIDVVTEIERNNLPFVKWITAHKDELTVCELEQGIAIAARFNSVEMAQCLAEWFPTTQ